MVLITACLLLGGASAAGFLANALLQLLSLLMIVLFGFSRYMPPLPAPARQLQLLVVLAAALPILQLAPLPPALWSMLPGRGEVAGALALVTPVQPWLPLSLAPDPTIAATLAVLPVAAIVAAALRAAAQAGRRAMLAVVAVGAGSVLLGAAQLAGGAESPLYPYAVTNRGSAVGLFANRNHLGTLLLCCLPIAAASAADTGSRRSAAAWLATGIALAAGALLTGSVAVAAMLPPVAAACAVFVLPDAIAPRLRLAITGTAAAMLIAGGIAGAMLADTGAPSAQRRGTTIPTTLRAARDHLPFGSGGGSFRLIYPGYEDPAAASPEYVNHAHSDIAELLLEYGVPGALLLLAALGWFAVRCRAIARLSLRESRAARAGCVVLGVVIVHSLVDYPIRTAAIAGVAALAAALVAMPAAAADPPRSPHRRRGIRERRDLRSIDLLKE